MSASSIQSFEDLFPILTINKPQRTLTLLHQTPGFEEFTFKSLINGFLHQTGWPLHPDDDPLGLSSLLLRIGYHDLSLELQNPGFQSQLLYQCATALDSLLSGQNIVVTNTFLLLSSKILIFF